MKKVLVMGDAMVDLYHHGAITRISPEAPVPVIKVDRIERRDGGAANVANNIEALGVPVARCFSRSYEMSPVTKTRLLAGRQHVARVDEDWPQQPIDLAQYKNLLDACDIVVLSDYGKGALANIAMVIMACKKAGKTVLVDPKSQRFLDYCNVDLLKPNLTELRTLVGGWSCREDMIHKVKGLQRRANISAVLITMGEDGMVLVNGSVTTLEAACFPTDLVDVSGAGDTAIAAFAASLARGFSYNLCAYFANRAAGIAVQRFGTALVTEKEVFG